VGTRVAVGSVLAVLAIIFVVYGGYWFFGMMMLIGLVGINEFYRLMRRYRPIALAGFAGLALMLSMAWFGDPVSAMGATAAALLLTFALAAIPGPKKGVSVRIGITLLGLLWVGWGVAYLLFIRQLPNGLWLTLLVVFGTWAGDTVAYFAGRYFGATPFAPRLSPKKTWEGFVCGFFGTLVVVVFLGTLYGGVGTVDSLLVGLAIAIVAPLGDLFESLLKRDVAIKDAGRFFPGHGGVLDRFDGLFFASVASYFVITGLF
jgi:phosphatidate cytidylyltransferase